MGPGPDGADHLVRLGGGEDELDVRRRLLDQLEQGVEPRRGHHVRLVDDVDLVAAGHRGEERPLPQVAGVVHAAVAGRVDLDHVDAARPAPGQVPAGLALAARHRDRPVLTVERAGQDPGRGGLAAAARAGEEVGVVDPVVGQRPLQRLGDVLLADDVGEGVRPVAPVQSERRRSGARRVRRLVEEGLVLGDGSPGSGELQRPPRVPVLPRLAPYAPPPTTRHAPHIRCRDGDPRRHLGLDVPAVARRLLPARAAAARRAGLRRRADEQCGGQRQLLLAAAAVGVRVVGGGGARRLRVRGQGRPVHHPHEEAERDRDAAGQLLRLRRAGARHQAGPAAVAAAAQPRLRRRADGDLPEHAAADGRPGGRDRRRPRPPGAGRPGRADRRAPRPPAAACGRGAARDVPDGGVLRPAATPRGRAGAGRQPGPVADHRRDHRRPQLRPAARARGALRQRLQRRGARRVGGQDRRAGGTPGRMSTSTATTTPRSGPRTTRWA